MKRVTATLVAVTLAGGIASSAAPAHADVYLVTPPARTERLDLDRHRAHKLKVAGIVLSVVGTAMVVTGAAIGGASRSNDGAWRRTELAAIGIAVPGAIAVTAGIPLWVIGATAERRHGVVQLAVAPNGVAGRF